LGLGGVEGAVSALAGGAAALAGTLVFLGVLRWRHRAAPTPWQALRALVMAEAAKWAVSLGGLASLLSGGAGVDAVSAVPGAAVFGFCVAWAAPLLALMRRN
jgi:F0F1-type ATP synthase assembly protein I